MLKKHALVPISRLFHRRLLTLLIVPALLGLVAFGGPAVAQTADTPTSGPAEVPEVVITGSRIARRDYDASSPIVSLGEQQLENTGAVALEEKLSQLPQFAAGQTSSSLVNANASGQATLNLRSLGPNRNLVLLDGRRLVPSTSQLTVDINNIPASIVEGVEVISGGASAVYGSDAVAGVVNFKIRNHFNGLQVDIQHNQSEHGDASDWDGSLLAGTDIADRRGNIMVAFEYFSRGEVVRGDRSFFSDAEITGLGPEVKNVTPPGATIIPADNLPSQAAVNAVFSRYGIAPGTVSNQSSFGFNQDGTLFSTGAGVHNFKGALGPSTGLSIVQGSLLYDGARDLDLVIPLKRYSAYSALNFDLTSRVNLYGSALFSSVNPIVHTFGAITNELVPEVPVTNPFIPADLATLLASRPNPAASVRIDKLMSQAGIKTVEHPTELFQFVMGAKGSVPIRDWTYDIYASRGQTRIDDDITNGGIRLSALGALYSAPDGGKSLCTGGYNPFGDNPISPSCVAFFDKGIHNSTQLDQDVAEGTVQGGIIALPAGDLRFAAGADYRSNDYTLHPDGALYGAFKDVASLATFPGSGGPLAGKISVKEAYGELLVPLLQNLPLVEHLEAELGYRYSNYSTSGGVSAYKANLNWTLTRGVRIRGGFERAVRAPNIAELFQPPSGSILLVGFAGDPCDIHSSYRAPSNPNAAQIRAICLVQGASPQYIDNYVGAGFLNGLQGGNPSLKPETADTYTLGFVLNPYFSRPLFSRISTSVDYFDIYIKGAIGSFDGSTILNNCYNTATNPSLDPNNAYCRLITRLVTGDVNYISQNFQNLGGYKVSGIDLQFDWRIDAGDVKLDDKYGSLGLNLNASYLKAFEIANTASDPFIDFSGTISSTPTPYPRLRASSTASYYLGPAVLGVRWMYIAAMKDVSAVESPDNVLPGVPAYSRFDLFGSYKLNASLTLRGGVDNLTDKNPLTISGTPGLTDPGTYDAVGRRYYLAVRMNF